MKNPTISAFTIKLLVLFAVIALYVNFVYFPLDKVIEDITAQRRQAEEISDKYAFFSANRQLMEEKIADNTSKIDALKAKSTSADPKKIADSISAMLVKSGAKAQSIVVSDPITLDKKSADGRSMLHSVSINVTLTTDAPGCTRFISALEQHESGAYSVDSTNYTEKEKKLTVLITMHYFAPEVKKK